MCELTRHTHVCTHMDVQNGARIPFAASGSSGAGPGLPERRARSSPPGLPFCHSSQALIYSCRQNISFNNSVGILHFLLGVAADGRLGHAQTFLSNSVSLASLSQLGVLSINGGVVNGQDLGNFGARFLPLLHLKSIPWRGLFCRRIPTLFESPFLYLTTRLL